jgi:hypothetical protein
VFAAAAQPALALEVDPKPCWKEPERASPLAASVLPRPKGMDGRDSLTPVAGVSAEPPAAQLQELEGHVLPSLKAEPFRLPVPNLGYTCLNISLQQQFGIRTNR